MPPWLEAIILGVVQGLTEFIPVSSSAHLVLVPYLAGWEHPGLAFDVALHIGTAAAVVVYFWRELVAMARGLLFGGRDADGHIYRRLALLVLLASVPVALVGYFLEDFVGAAFEKPLVVAGLLLITAALLFAGERSRDLRVRRSQRKAAQPDRGKPVWTGDWRGTPSPATGAGAVGVLPVGDDGEDPAGQTLDRLSLRHAVTIGLFQAVAILPGVSRSGSTITAGMMSGLTREAATRFSFLLSLPALVGAFIVSLPDLSEAGSYSGPVIAGGVLASFIAGYAAIRFLVRLVARDRLTGFARYCIFLSIVTLIAYQFLGPPSVGV